MKHCRISLKTLRKFTKQDRSKFPAQPFARRPLFDPDAHESAHVHTIKRVYVITYYRHPDRTIDRVIM